MRILFIAAEAVPFFKVGGLGDVAGTLPGFIASRSSNMDIRLFLPLHRKLDRSKCDLEFVKSFPVYHPDGDLEATAYHTDLNGLNVYFIDGDLISDQSEIYTSDPAVDGMKYVFFSLAALELTRSLEWAPDIVHAHDWHTAPSIYALTRQKDPFFQNTKTIQSIHNLPYLGQGAETALASFGFEPTNNGDLPVWARFMPLPLGISAADIICTVSKGYRDEILTEPFGSGLQDYFKRNEERLTGILNGLDTQSWDPQTDSNLIPFSKRDIEDRLENKYALQKEVGFGLNERIPLIGVVSRMDQQKGIDLIDQSFRSLIDRPWRSIILGTGNPEIEERVRRIGREFPDRVHVILKYDEAMARKIFAGSDMMLIPSRYEPCGLTQMISMRYGCVPIARATGGLNDTITDFSQGDQATGFLFKEASSDELEAGIRRALEIFASKNAWRQLQLNGMSQDFSWDKSAEEYIQLYKKVLQKT